MDFDSRVSGIYSKRGNIILTEKIAEKVYATQAEICIGVTNIEKHFLFSCDVINEFHNKVQEGSLSVV